MSSVSKTVAVVFGVAMTLVAIIVGVMLWQAPEHGPLLEINATSQPAHADQGDVNTSQPSRAIAVKSINLLDDATLKQFWIDPDSHYVVKGGVLTVHNPSGKGPGFRALIGGAALDNYRVSLEFRITDPGSPDRNQWKGGFPANVQIAPNFGNVFCQVFRDGACNLAYVDTDFHHVQTGGAPLNLDDWNSLSAEVHNGFASMVVNDEKSRSGNVPIGTAGALGLLINNLSDATTEIRNVKLELFSPTEDQLQQLKSKASPGGPMK
jgi:hypothetical protein